MVFYECLKCRESLDKTVVVEPTSEAQVEHQRLVHGGEAVDWKWHVGIDYIDSPFSTES